MSMRERFERLARAAAGRPILTLGIVLALAVGGGLLALRLKPSTGIDTFVSSSSRSYQATVDDQRHFGSDAVVILIREPLDKLVLSKDLGHAQLPRGVPGRSGRSPEPPARRLYAGAGQPGGAVRRFEEPVRAADEGKAGPGGVRPRHVPQPGGHGRQFGDLAKSSGRTSSRSRTLVRRRTSSRSENTDRRSKRSRPPTPPSSSRSSRCFSRPNS